MRKAAARCIRRRAPVALLALVAFTATAQAPSAGAASKNVLSSTSAVTVTQATAGSLSISWQRVRRAAGYDLSLNGTRVGETQTTAYTFASLRCGATYQLGVDAFNVKGVRSSIVSVTAGTSACPVAVVGNDTSPPTSPTSLTQGATTTTSISLLWSASLDNVGVAGYDLFLNGSKVGTTTATSYTFANLSCGTSYTLAVDAYDAAGNRSQSAAVLASTSPCPDTSPPTIPTLPTQTGSTTTSISLLWSASLDNVGVAGYDLFLNGSKLGTTTATSYTFASLSCGTSYTLAVDAFDAAGNRSQQASLATTTSACATPNAPLPPVPGSWTLKFADEFNDSTLDLSKWRPNWLGGSDTQVTKPINSAELSCYDPAQVREGGGVVTLSAVQQACTANNGVTYGYRSGLIESYNHYQFTYGYLEARMWLPQGTGTPVDWPAFWADGTGTWPTTGEIDVMEVLGGGTLCWHFHYSSGAPGGCPTIPNPTGWHTFGADWEPGSITFYYDGVLVGQLTQGVTASPMYLIANLGISTQHGGPLSVPAKVDLDYVRVWQH
jgi:beta-glucanase (GH16 family)